jgi:hypothetical protein
MDGELGKKAKNHSPDSRSPRFEGGTSRTRSRGDTLLIETFGELVQNFVINEDAWSSSRIMVRVFTLLPARGSKERRTLEKEDRGGHTVWYKFTEMSETSQICDTLSLLLSPSC